MWRWTMLVMCLIAALSGTPLRQAEAASDLARALADLDASGDVEVPDGGVGDDSGATIKSENTSASSVMVLCTEVSPGLSSLAGRRSMHQSNPLDHRPPRSCAARSARLARLQSLLC